MVRPGRYRSLYRPDPSAIRTFEAKQEQSQLGEQYQDVDAMIFRFRGKEFKGVSWIDVVRSLERDDEEYCSCGGPIRQYLTWSLNQLSGTVGPRDIDLSDRLEDETLALGYLLLLDEYGVGEVVGPIDRPKE